MLKTRNFRWKNLSMKVKYAIFVTVTGVLMAVGLFASWREHSSLLSILLIVLGGLGASLLTFLFYQILVRGLAPRRTRPKPGKQQEI